MKKTEIKAGRTVSAIGIIFGVIAIIFGIFWIAMLSRLSGQDEEMEPGVVFLLIFGVMFIIAAIAITSFYAKSAYGKNRPSILDVEEASGEEASTAIAADDKAAPKEEANFCPYCGKSIEKEFSYCKYCGKKMS
ncbi:MAG: hypothetical protein MUP71_13645 [Candidatus Aminicenantes bacterium]|nr:hypothetical protein [Candidatus Aminicenantes bacterium]